MSLRCRALHSANTVRKKDTLSKDNSLEALSGAPARHFQVKEKLNHNKRVVFAAKAVPSKLNHNVYMCNTKIKHINCKFDSRFPDILQVSSGRSP